MARIVDELGQTFTPKQKVETPNVGIGTQIARAIPQGLAAAGEAIVGLPGNIISSILDVASTPFGGKSYKDVQQESGYLTLPTSEQIKENVSKPLFKAVGAERTPQGNLGELTEQAIENGIFLAMPFLGGLSKGRAAIAGLGGAGAKQLVKYMGGGPTAQAFGNLLGTMGLSTLGTRRQLGKEAETILKDLEKEAPKQGFANATNLENEMKNISKRAGTKDIGSDAANFIKERVDYVLKRINPTEETQLLFNAPAQNLSIADALDAYRDINLQYANAPTAAKPFLNQAREKIGQFITKNTKDKGFVNAFNRSNSIYRGLKASGTLSDNVMSAVKTVKPGAFKSDTVSKLATAFAVPAAYAAGGTASFLLGGGPGILKAGAVGGLGRMAYKLYTLIQTSPEARNAYAGLLRAAASGSTVTILSNLQKLDRAAEKLERKNPNYENEPLKKIAGITIV